MLIICLYIMNDPIFINITMIKLQVLTVLTLVVLLVSLVSGTKVTFSNLATFFNSTLDPNNDGWSTMSEFVEYFQFMEPEHNLTESNMLGTFEMLDLDGDRRIALGELVKIAGITVHYSPGHKQIHLGLTGTDTEMQVMWVSNPEAY